MHIKNETLIKKLLILMLFTILCSCSADDKGKGIDFKIVNNSDFVIREVKITTSENLVFEKFNKIEPNKSISGFLSMKDNKTDGSYILSYIGENQKLQSSGYGYYTNGASFDSWVEFVVKNDSVNCKFSGTGY